MANIGDQVKLDYAFDGVHENNELTLAEGDIVTLTNTDVGEGWYEGRTSSGEVGLFPISYAQPYAENSSYSATVTDSYDYTSQAAQPSESQDLQDDDGDDDWDDQWQVTQQQQQPAATTYAAPTNESLTSNDEAYRRDSVTTGLQDDSPKKGQSGKSGGLFGKGIFSSFTSSPSAAYVSGECKSDVSSVPKINIEVNEEGPCWPIIEQSFSCTVSNPTKASKFSGLKSYIAYNITSSHTNKTVSRRYKHFDWLYEQLMKKFGCTVVISQLPDKQITGRYEEEFIETRRRQLEHWINRMSLHPIISSSEVFQHFLSCKDNEKPWKTGKRKAEHDVAVGSAFLMTLVPPQQRLDLPTEEKRLESYAKFTKSFGDTLKQTISVGSDYVKNCSGSYMKEYQKIGQLFGAMSNAFSMDERPVAQPLTEAIKHTGKTYEEIGELIKNQPQYDWLPFLDGLHDYSGQLSCFPNIIDNSKSALEKQKDMTKQQIEGKISLDEVDRSTNRAETVCFAVQAEINHLQYYRVGDFSNYMKNFLEQQRAYHLEVASKIEQTLEAYKSLANS